MIMIIRSSFE